MVAPSAVISRVWSRFGTLIRYSAVSVVSTAFSSGALALFYGVLHLWSEVPSTLVANVLAIAPSYYLNRRWAWGKGGRSHLVREVTPFWALSVAGILLSMFAAGAAHSFSVEHQLAHSTRTFLVLGVNIAAFGVLWVVKYLVFNRLFAESGEPGLERPAEADASVATTDLPTA